MVEVQQVRDGLPVLKGRLEAVTAAAAEDPGDWTAVAETLEGLAGRALELSVAAWRVAGEQVDAG